MIVRVRFFAIATTLFLGFTLFSSKSALYGQDEHHDGQSSAMSEEAQDSHSGEAEEFNPSTFLEHIKDSHEWHILTKKDGNHVSVPLPVILYSKHSGLHAFSSKKIAHGHSHNGFQMGHGTLMLVNKNGESIEKSLDGKIIEVDEHGEMVEAGLPLDFSITKNVFMMILLWLFCSWVFLSLARSYKKTGISEPKGLMGFIEPVIVFIEEDVAIPNIGEDKYARYMPYLLTVFFFILLNNLMGLIPFFPFGANVTGNIAVTFVLAIFTFFITNSAVTRRTGAYIQYTRSTGMACTYHDPGGDHRNVYQAICTDDPTFCQHYSRTHHCIEPDIHDLHF